MHQSDHFLITEAWRKFEALQQEARENQLLTHFRKTQPRPWRTSLARFLLRLAERLEPSLESSLQPPAQTRTGPKEC